MDGCVALCVSSLEHSLWARGEDWGMERGMGAEFSAILEKETCNDNGGMERNESRAKPIGRDAHEYDIDQ